MAAGEPRHFSLAGKGSLPLRPFRPLWSNHSQPHCSPLYIISSTLKLIMSMKAITLSGFGNEQDLKLSEVSIPQTGANDVLIKVHAFSLNPVRTCNPFSAIFTCNIYSESNGKLTVTYKHVIRMANSLTDRCQGSQWTLPDPQGGSQNHRLGWVWCDRIFGNEWYVHSHRQIILSCHSNVIFA